MLNLKDSRWAELQDAYGPASQIPDFLQQVIANKSLKHDSQSGPWYELWSRLYHQGSIYSASYAAVPVIVEAAKQADLPIAMDFFLMPASIELARNSDDAPPIPDDVKSAYLAAIKDLGMIASKYTEEESDPSLKKAAKAAQFVSEGKFEQAKDVIET